MTRDEAEAVIWQHAPALASDRFADRFAAMNTIMAAVDDYATTQCAIALDLPDGFAQARRRATLADAVSRRRRSLPPVRRPAS